MIDFTLVVGNDFLLGLLVIAAICGITELLRPKPDIDRGEDDE